MRRRISFLALCGLLMTTSGAGAEEWAFATLEWPPFSGSLPEGGSMASVLRAAYGSQGHGVTTTIMPWKRATLEAMRTDGPFIGFFTATPSECAAAGGILSDSPLGFYTAALAQRANRPLRGVTADDLRGLTIGVVDGYDIGAALRALSDAGTVTLDTAISDEANLRKLQAGRIDAALVEKAQFTYLAPLFNRAAQSGGLSALSLHEQPLGKPAALHACFNHGPKAAVARQSLERGLQVVDADMIADHYLKELGLDERALSN